LLTCYWRHLRSSVVGITRNSCIIPFTIFLHNVIGYTYEKTAILQWIANNQTSPITRNKLSRKHLVPNRALKEAIQYESEMKKSFLSSTSNHHRRDTWSYSTNNPSAISTSSTPAIVANKCPPKHHQILNTFLSSLNDKYRLDCFGTAFLPMSFADGESKKMLLVIEAPISNDTTRLYTHFVGNIERCKESITTNEKVLSNLLYRGKHKSLTLGGVGENRMRFSFEEKNSEFSTEEKVKGMLNMFVMVSFRMKKTIEMARSSSRDPTILLPNTSSVDSDSTTAALPPSTQDCIFY
jgi:hypothetical protein